MKELIQKLEAAVLRRNPLLAKSLQPGLPVEKISKDLNRAGIKNAINPITELYSWRNETALQGNAEALNAGFTPPIEYRLSENERQTYLRMGIKRNTASRSYHFIELKKAIVDMGSYKTFAQHQPRLDVLVERYFPFLWDGSTEWIALEIEPAGSNRVVRIQLREATDDQLLREAYDSYEDFLKDAIRANENNEPLACIRTLGKPITETPENHPTPAAKPLRPKAGKIPETENPLVLRTDFSDESEWKSLCKALQDPGDEFSPSLDFVSDPTFDGLAADALRSLVSGSSPHTFAFIVDSAALTRSGNPVLMVDLQDKPGRTFRAIVSALGDVANNLSIANMDFDEFAKAVDKEGVFRGFI